MSSQYSVLDNRPIDQWKVTELREELKKRKLTTKGLKEDLVKRLDESVRSENESVEIVAETTKDIAESGDNINEKLDGAIQDDIIDSRDSLDKEKNVEGQLIGDTDPAGLEMEQVVQAASVESSIMVSERVVNEIPLSGHDMQTNKTQNETGDSKTLDMVSETTMDVADLSNNRNEKLDGAIQADINDSRDSLNKEKNVEGQLIVDTDSAGVEVEQGVQAASVETSLMVSESVVSEITGHDLRANKTQNETEDSKTVDIVAETTMDVADLSDNINEKLDGDIQVDINDTQGSLDKEKNLEGQLIGDTDPVGGEVEQVVESTSVETSIMVSESVVSELTLSGHDLQTNKTQKETGDSKHQPKNEDLKPRHEDAKLNSSDPSNQVSEVSPVLGFSVKSDSISTDSVSINEKNELKDYVIADDDKLELDVKPEMVLPLSSNAISDGGLQPLDVEGPYENKGFVEKTGNGIAENADMGKKNNSGEVGSPEKLNLDRSSGDDSMEEDVLECKQIDSKFSSSEVRDKGDRTEVPVVEEERPVGVTRDALPAYQKNVFVENKNGPALSKRKLHDPEKVGNNETTKRQRRWNSEGLKFPEAQSIDVAPSPTPKDTFQRRHNLSRSDSMAIDEVPKEREVPPSSTSPTNSLRIDRFLRPFTLKAVQELLGKTGNVTSFWMDNIKTHCYVTYSSIEEAVETRNGVYNLQWPPNGGRLLVAEFVDPQEVKKRVEVPPQSPTTPASTGPTIPAAPPTLLPQPSPRQQVQRQKVPLSPPLPPPPPLTNPPPARERLTLPPPPPLPEKVDPPIVTLDDLFRKTKATPRIYYLPLSDGQVASKLKAQGKNAKL